MSAGHQRRWNHGQHWLLPAEDFGQAALLLLHSDSSAEHPFKALGNYGKANRKRQSRPTEMHSLYSLFLAQKTPRECKRGSKREGQGLFFHSRVLYSTGIPHTLHNAGREST